MKSKYFSLLLMVLLIGSTSTLDAQDAFSGKRKQNKPLPAMSFQPVQVTNQQSIKGRQSESNTSTMPFAGERSLSRINSREEGPSIIYNSKNGLPIFITSPVQSVSARRNINGNVDDACFAYLDELKTILRLDNTREAFRIHAREIDNENKTHLRLEQLYKEVPVYGSEVIVHVNASGFGEAFNGRYERIPAGITTVPSLSKEQAIGIVSMHLKPVQPKQFELLPGGNESTATLYIYPDKQLITSFVLAYHVVTYSNMHRWEYFIDASTGAILKRFDSTCFIDGPRTATASDLNNVSRTINTYQAGSSYYMLDATRPMYAASKSSLPDNPVGGILTVDMNNTFGKNQAFKQLITANNVWTNKTAVSAHFNAGAAYEYFRTKHNRNSIDGQNGSVISVINVVDEKGAAMDNAYWNGKAMFYGNGDVGFKPLAGALDVSGHEMTHGVVENTANLVYQGESGAINESMSDIFGAMMDPEDWLIGEDIVKLSAFPSGALRSLSDPHNGGTNLNSPGFQPKHMSEKYTGTGDYGGVHINSGIPNHAFFKYATAITRDKAAAVFYKALKDYLTKSSQFIDLRLAVIKAATDLYGAGSNEVTQAGLAFDAVGIGSGTGGTTTTTTYDVNPGQEYLLVNNTDPADVNTLYRSSSSGTNLQPLSNTVMLSKPSVVDNGSGAVFVAGDNTLRYINTIPGSAPAETVIQNDPAWSNIVVSKDGSKIAAVTTAVDTSIYVYDFASQAWARFQLYNPTYSSGVNSSGPVYADALEWDYTGQYLVYDALNRIKNSNGQDIEYWDVGFIEVWDNKNNKFGSGNIAKLFTSLPSNVSIGNPSFSKLSQNIIAFDYVNTYTAEYAVLGCNIENNDVNTIVANNTLGYPSFNKDDTRVGFTSKSGSKFLINYVTLNADKISSNNAINPLLIDAAWPVYYAIGERDYGNVITGTEDVVVSKPLLACYPNPLREELTIAFGEGTFGNGKVELLNNQGQSVNSFLSSGESETKIDTRELTNGMYLVRVKTNQGVGYCRVAKR